MRMERAKKMWKGISPEMKVKKRERFEKSAGDKMR